MALNIIFYVYDIRSQLNEFVASFALKAHAVAYATATFGRYGYVTDKRHHKDRVWNGASRNV